MNIDILHKMYDYMEISQKRIFIISCKYWYNILPTTYIIQYKYVTQNIDLIEWAHANNCFRSHLLSKYAAENNNEQVINFLIQNYYYISYEMYYTAAKKGNLDMVYLLYNEKIYNKYKHFSKYKCIFISDDEYKIMSTMLYDNAALNNDINIIKKLPCNHIVNSACINASKKLNMEILEWLYYKNIKPDKHTTKWLAYNGKLSGIIWAFENNIEITEESLYYAAKNGKINIIKWILKMNCVTIKTHTSDLILGKAAKHNHNNIFEYIYSIFGITRYNMVCDYAIKGNNLYIIDLLYKKYNCKLFSTPVFRYEYFSEFLYIPTVTVDTIYFIINELKYSLKNISTDMYMYISNVALYNNNIDLLKYIIGDKKLYEIEYYELVELSIYFNSKKILDWLMYDYIYSNKYEDKYKILYKGLSNNGELHTIKMLMNKIPIDNYIDKLCEGASIGGSLNILKWLYNQKFNITLYLENICKNGIKYEHIHILEWIMVTFKYIIDDKFLMELDCLSIDIYNWVNSPQMYHYCLINAIENNNICLVKWLVYKYFDDEKILEEKINSRVNCINDSVLWIKSRIYQLTNFSI